MDIASDNIAQHADTANAIDLQIKTHLGLGDAFVVQGIVHHYMMSGKVKTVHINTRPQYVPDLQRLYAHFGGAVVLHTHDTYSEAPATIEGMPHVDTGFFDTTKDFYPKFWDREFYRQAGVPFVERWTNSYIPTHDLEPVKRRDFTIRHHDPARKHVIDGLKPDVDIVAGDRTRLLDWVPELMAAKAIHCIDSCVLNLVESLYHAKKIRDDAKLFFHAYARDAAPPTLLAPWKTLF